MTNPAPRLVTAPESISTPNRQSRMAKIVCLYCSHVIENPPASPSQCPACGRTFPLANDSTHSQFRGPSTSFAPGRVPAANRPLSH